MYIRVHSGYAGSVGGLCRGLFLTEPAPFVNSVVSVVEGLAHFARATPPAPISPPAPAARIAQPSQTNTVRGFLRSKTRMAAAHETCFT